MSNKKQKESVLKALFKNFYKNGALEKFAGGEIEARNIFFYVIVKKIYERNMDDVKNHHLNEEEDFLLERAKDYLKRSIIKEIESHYGDKI